MRKKKTLNCWRYVWFDANSLWRDSDQKCKVHEYRSWRAHVPFVIYLSVFDSAKTSMTEARLSGMRSRESAWNIGLHPRDNHLRSALGTHSEVPALEAINIHMKSSSGLSTELHGWVQRQHRSDTTEYRNKVVGSSLSMPACLVLRSEGASTRRVKFKLHGGLSRQVYTLHIRAYIMDEPECLQLLMLFSAKSNIFCM